MRAGGTTGAVGTIGRSAHSAPLRSTCCAACATEACCQLELIASFESSNLMRQPGSSFRQVPQFKTVGRFYGQFGGILSVERGIVQNMAVCSEPYLPVRKHRPIAHLSIGLSRLSVILNTRKVLQPENATAVPLPGQLLLCAAATCSQMYHIEPPYTNKLTHTHALPHRHTHTHLFNPATTSQTTLQSSS